MRKQQILKACVGATTALVVSLGMMTPASADLQPTVDDAVGVGSNTLQYVADFLSDGQSFLPLPAVGFNTFSKARIFSFHATADASGRLAFDVFDSPDNYWLSGPSWAPTVVLRAGAMPVKRPNGSSSGITALLNDSAHQIAFVRSSRAPKAAEAAAATANPAIGGLHVYKVANDGMKLAYNNMDIPGPDSCVPSGMTTQDIREAYTNAHTWNSLNTFHGGGLVFPGDCLAADLADSIIPVVPQGGSGTRSDFLGSIGNPVLGSHVVVGEEHDPVAITSTSYPENTLAPFSTGRYNMINQATVPAGGYFQNTFGQAPVSLLTGASDYNFNRTLYIIVRQVDKLSTTPFVAGSAANMVNTLFGTATSWYARNTNAGLYTAAGVTKSWADLGVA